MFGSFNTPPALLALRKATLLMTWLDGHTPTVRKKVLNCWSDYRVPIKGSVFSTAWPSLLFQSKIDFLLFEMEDKIC